MQSDHSFTLVISDSTIHATQMMIMEALVDSGLPEAYELRLYGLAEQMEVQKLHSLAHRLGISPIGFYRGEAVDQGRSEGMAVFCIFKTEQDAQRFSTAVR